MTVAMFAMKLDYHVQATNAITLVTMYTTTAQ
jgi:hypothetical protein